MSICILSPEVAEVDSRQCLHHLHIWGSSASPKLKLNSSALWNPLNGGTWWYMALPVIVPLAGSTVSSDLAQLAQVATEGGRFLSAGKVPDRSILPAS